MSDPKRLIEMAVGAEAAPALLMKLSPTIWDAILFAAAKHEGQTRKCSGAPYVVHPIRVMARFLEHLEATEAGAIAAVLHDTVEDTDTSPAEIRQRYGAEVADLVRALTKNPDPKMNRAARKDDDRKRLSGAPKTAKILKLLDILDNTKEIDTRGFTAKFMRLFAVETRAMVVAIGEADTSLACELIEANEDLENRADAAETAAV